MSASEAERRLAEAPTVIDAGASFEGVLTFRGSARVDGRLTGRVVADGCLVIGPKGHVEATVEVDELVVAGAFEGEATARSRLALLPSARAAGRLRAASFALADGCHFDGRWETLGVAPEPAADAPERAPDAATGAAEAASAP